MKSTIVLLILLLATAADAVITRDECKERGGNVISNKGDVEVFKAGYQCENSNEPPIKIEGNEEVCCGASKKEPVKEEELPREHDATKPEPPSPEDNPKKGKSAAKSRRSVVRGIVPIASAAAALYAHYI
ncbi:expressed unknown protein [Seminavis robusta]|uniref:Uncharacterized protein n=1 Tax=Seminavis robusta TaxID=568900 RepID=A0A9N8E437_9STRA|nr:expressed unknown protein [Seminavis robusta]|eukprot:Sro599_g173260.1 n/a (130) ;mRNA; f:35394-35783